MRKKLLKGLITSTLLVSIFSINLISPLLAFAEDTKESSLKNDDGILKFAVISDTHVGPTKPKENKRLAEFFNKIYEKEPNLDAVTIVGDITDNGSKAQYDTFSSIISNNKKSETELVVSMGNHEGNTAPLFTEATGNLPKDNKIIDGYHFITLSPRSSENTYGGSRYYLDEAWLKEQLDNATKEDSTKPIFLFLHHGIKDTAYGTDDWYTPDLKELLSNYPQVIQFSGHSHYPLNDPRSIYQKDFTAINTSTTSYFELESGMYYGTIPPNANNAFQSMLFEVNGTKVTIKKLDLLSGETIGEDWVFDTASGKEGFKYTDARKDASPSPYFEDKAEATISNIKDTSCTVTIDQGKIEDIPSDNHDEIVHSYKFDFTEKRTGKLQKSYKIWSEYYFLPTSEKLTQNFDGLKAGNEYELTVTAINSYGKTSNETLKTAFKTTGDGFVVPDDEELLKPVLNSELLDINFLDGTAKDTSPNNNSFEIKGNPSITFDNSLKKNVANFNGNDAFKYPFSENNYSKIKNNVSMETVVKIDKIDGSTSNSFSNMESAGLGFEAVKINGDDKNAIMEFWVRVRNSSIGTGSYHKVSGTIKLGEYNHVVGTYDGERINIYINGELDNSKEVKGQVYYPTGNAKAFFLGSDTNGNGEIQNPMKGSISLARLYSRTLSALETYKLHRNELSNKLKDNAVILKDVPNISGSINSEINIPVTLTNIPRDKNIKSIEMDFDIPSDLAVNSVTLDSSVISQENFDYNLSEGKLRVALTNTSGKELSVSNNNENIDLATLKLSLKTEKTDDDTIKVKGNNFVLRCDDNLDIEYNMDKASSTISFKNSNNLSISARELYTTVKDEVIPDGFKAYAIEFIGVNSNYSVTSNDNIDLYYSNEFTSKNAKETYIALIKDDITMDSIENLNNYTIEKSEEKLKNQITFGDINNDGIDAQDALSSVSSWLRKINPNEKNMLSINVNGDSLINTRDAISIVDNYISSKDFEILNK
ncbi:MAG: LamG-like jellyroll fold domain-containing protein [Sarcina sp.]